MLTEEVYIFLIKSYLGPSQAFNPTAQILSSGY